MMDTWKIAEEVCRTHDIVLLYGRPGTGKTYAGLHFLPFWLSQKSEEEKWMFHMGNVVVTDDTPMSELRGHYVPKENRFVWKDGPVLTVFRHGGRIVINEVAQANSDVLSFLLAILDSDDSSYLTLPTGETIRRNERFSCVCTMNGSPDDLPKPLKERLTVKIHINQPHPGAFLSLPYEYQKVAANLLSDQVNSVPLREFKAWISLLHLGEEEAAYACWGKKGRDVLVSIRLGTI